MPKSITYPSYGASGWKQKTDNYASRAVQQNFWDNYGVNQKSAKNSQGYDPFQSRNSGGYTAPTAGSYDVNSLIDRQLQQTQQFRDQQSRDRQLAVDTLKGYDPNQYSNVGLLKGELDYNPFGDVDTVRRSIQSILDNPNILSDAQIQTQRDSIRNQSVFEQQQAQQAALNAAGARGMADSGLTQEQLASLGAQFGAQRFNDIADLEYRNELDTANRLAAAQAALSSLELGVGDINSRYRGNLLGLIGNSGDTASRLDLERLGAISELYGNTEYFPDDYGGIAALKLAQQSAADDRALQNRQYDYLNKQLESQNQQFNAYGDLLKNQLSPGSSGVNVNYLSRAGNQTDDLYKKILAAIGGSNNNSNFFTNMR